MENTKSYISEVEEKGGSTAEFDSKKKYSDEFYDEYIACFRRNTKKRYLYKFFKRSFDIVMSLLCLIVLSPVMLVIAIAIKIDSKGPVIFKQKRMGKKGREFYCYKFRSMMVDAPKDLPTSLFTNSSQYQTKVGHFLRKFSLDELPQLFCCFVGTMSFIGYRPLCLTEENCNNMREKLGVFEMRPGISGYAQVSGRDDVYYKNKAIMDAEYVKKASMLFDIKLMFQTVAVVLRREGNDSDDMKKTEDTYIEKTESK